MESSKKNLFETDHSKWHLALGKRSLGPLKSLELYEMLQKQEISMAHYIWKTGFKNWVRICDVEPFKDLAPSTPGVSIPKTESKSEIKKAETRVSTESWFIFNQGSQVGPFTSLELERLVQIGKIGAKTQAWKHGLPNWMMLGSIDKFKNIFSKTNTDPTTIADQRKADRKPLVARIFVSDDQTMVIGICRDISIGGMQVLTDKVPGKVGSKIKLNVSPSDAKEMGPFVAEGKVVRILDDGLGFSFRFDQLSENAKNAIQEFISN